jgi:hypothetical protein
MSRDPDEEIKEPTFDFTEDEYRKANDSRDEIYD